MWWKLKSPSFQNALTNKNVCVVFGIHGPLLQCIYGAPAFVAYYLFRSQILWPRVLTDSWPHTFLVKTRDSRIKGLEKRSGWIKTHSQLFIGCSTLKTVYRSIEDQGAIQWQNDKAADDPSCESTHTLTTKYGQGPPIPNSYSSRIQCSLTVNPLTWNTASCI